MLDEFVRPVSPSPYGLQTLMTGDTIASLSQNLTPEAEEATVSVEDIDMTKANGATHCEGQGEKSNEQGEGVGGSVEGKGLDTSQHALGPKGNHAGAGS